MTAAIETPDLAEDDYDGEGPTFAVSTVEYLRAEHVAQMRLANAGRGVKWAAKLVRSGWQPQCTLDAAKVELEAAQNALRLVHDTLTGSVPSAEVYAAMGVNPAKVEYLRHALPVGAGA